MRIVRLMGSKLTLALIITAVLMTSIVVIPAATALTARTTFNDNHYTASRPGGSQRICGDHVCAPGEYDKMLQALSQAQMTGKNTPATPPPTTTPTPPATTTPTTPTTTMPSMTVCSTVKASLTNAGMSSTIVAKVLADLGCS